MRRGWRTIGESGEDKVWRFYSEEEEQTRVDIRSKTIGRDAVSGEETNALQSDDERREERNVSDQSEEQNINSRRHDTNEQEQTWWQVESNFRGIPNGISYELDKDRANRIKTLGKRTDDNRPTSNRSQEKNLDKKKLAIKKIDHWLR